MPRYVTVACKIPMGITLDVMPEIPAEKDLPFAMDGKTRYVPDQYRTPLASFRLNGFSRPVGVDIDDAAPRAGGYGLTHDVDGDMWDKWLAQNANSPMVKNNLVFSSNRPNDAKSQAKEQAETRSNLEPMSNNDPRTPKSRGLKIEQEKAA